MYIRKFKNKGLINTIRLKNYDVPSKQRYLKALFDNNKNPIQKKKKSSDETQLLFESSILV